jgi:hypothetical protein
MIIRRRTGWAARQVLLVALIVAAWGLAGCGGILTDAQVAAVNQFAEATKGFGTSPGTVMTAYAGLRSERALLESVSRTDGNAAARDLANGLAQRIELESRAASSDAAIGVLDDYAQMLSLLSSSKFTDDLQNQTIALGGSIDNGIATFNKLSGGAPVSSFGDIVAGIVRGAGGLWIRHEQHKALVAAVTQAKGPIDRLTASVEDLMTFFVGPPPSEDPDKNLFARESKEVQGFLARSQPAGRPLDVLERTQTAMKQAIDGQNLAKSCRRAAVQYRDAHNELVQAITNEKIDLKGLIAKIQALSQEIKAAKRVQREVKNARQ